MYTEDLIKEIITDVSKLFRKTTLTGLFISRSWYEKEFRLKNYYDSYPEFNPIYRQTIIEHDRVAIHADSRYFPYEVLKAKAPNQSEAEWEYQMGLYEPDTTATWDWAKNKTKVIANAQNYNINWPDEEQKEYFFEEYPNYHSFTSWMFDIYRDRKVNYPNQIGVARPYRIPKKLNGEGQEVVDQSVMVDPVVFIYEEKNVVRYKENDYLLLLLNEQVPLSSGGKGNVFEFFDRNAIWRITQTGWAENKPTYDYQEIYVHDWGYLPARKLRGTPKEVEGEVYYESVFSGAIPDLNKVIRLNSNLDMAEYSHAFPKFYRLVDTCKHNINGQPCTDGKIFSTDHGWTICPSCKGSGIPPVGPTSEMQIPATRGATGTQTNELPINPPMGYVEPNGNTLKHLDERIDKKKKAAFSFIFNIDESTNRTAEEVRYNSQGWLSLILGFSNEFFDDMEFFIEAIGWYRWRDKFEMPEISRPMYFNFRTVSEITEELKSARENNMPEPIIKALIEEMYQTRFNNNETAKRYTQLTMYADRLWNKSEQEVRAMLNSTANSATSIVHSSITAIIEQCEQEDDKFWTLEPPQQKEKIFAIAEQIASTAVPAPASPAADILAATGGGGVTP